MGEPLPESRSQPTAWYGKEGPGEFSPDKASGDAGGTWSVVELSDAPWPLDAAHPRKPDSDRFAGRRFDATARERAGRRVHAVKIKRHTEFLRIARTAALGTQLQPPVIS